MSRTIRRKNYVPKWVTHESVFCYAGFAVLKRVKKEGKALAKSLAKHHGDHGYRTNSASGHGCPKWFRQDEEHSFRTFNRLELHKFLRDNDYECMILSKSKLPYWD